MKQTLQYLIFPEGIIYDCKKGVFRTEKVNEVFARIAVLNNLSGQNETGQNNTKIDLSCLVGMTRFELATPRPPDVCATGLRYIPKKPDGKTNWNFQL